MLRNATAARCPGWSGTRSTTEHSSWVAGMTRPGVMVYLQTMGGAPGGFAALRIAAVRGRSQAGHDNGWLHRNAEGPLMVASENSRLAKNAGGGVRC